MWLLGFFFFFACFTIAVFGLAHHSSVGSFLSNCFRIAAELSTFYCNFLLMCALPVCFTNKVADITSTK